MTDNAELSDEATGLPPLHEVGDGPVILGLSFGFSNGIAANDFTRSDEPIRYLHVRGLIGGPGPDEVEWAQVHIAVPVSIAMDVAARLAAGGGPDAG